MEHVTYDRTYASYSVHSMVKDNQWAVGGYEAPLAYGISEYLDTDVLIINVGISSASVDYLRPYSVGFAYVNQVIFRALAIVQQDYRIERLAYAWMQGEADARMSISEYCHKFMDINRWYDAMGFDSCYLVQTRPSDGGNASVAQLILSEKSDRVILASTAPQTFTIDNGMMVADDLHYSQKGRLTIASDILAAMF